MTQDGKKKEHADEFGEMQVKASEIFGDVLDFLDDLPDGPKEPAEPFPFGSSEPRPYGGSSG